MDKQWKKTVTAGAAAVMLTGAFGYGLQEQKVSAAEQLTAQSPGTKPASAVSVQKEVLRQANRALRALADRDFDKLADLASPSGVRFSPYAYVLPKSDRILTPRQLRQVWTDKKTYVWGSYDGSGEPIRLDFRGYYGRFLNNLPYTAPDGIGYNRIVRSGSMPSNLRKVYPEAEFVEFYVKGGRGGSPNTGGMDWGSLRFVWEQIEGEWKLVGIVGDRWTI
ncbi:hypothetical protein [Saccharibacillus deserti]|uniref:hypothetical protein n=1 Tax=Saccharibacillus deserti TaxID=1634444 RepID=UPI00155641F3|nr:hypothetical protein [Saccharibacillus deserti]